MPRRTRRRVTFRHGVNVDLPSCFLWRPAARCANLPGDARHLAAPGERRSRHMGFTDKIKGLIGDNKSAVEDGIDKAADMVESKTPDSVDAQVEKGADALKDVVEKLD
jgi:hypothetical protein